MKRELRRLILSHALLLALLYAVLFLPKSRETTRSCGAFLVGIALIELVFLAAFLRGRGRNRTAPFGIIVLVWAVLLVWELTSSVYNIAHPVLIPAPENVFDTFRDQWRILLLNVGYSLQLLLTGMAVGLVLAVACGIVAGWIPRIRAFAYPIANVMAPIPAIVISPYLVALMPTFRSASLVVIVLGVFWPTFLNTVNRIQAIEPKILDSARMLHPGTATMMGRILLPYLLPGIIGGLKVTMTTSLLMLNFAELMGATHGMGYYIQNSITYANYTHAVAGIFVTGLVVTALSALVGLLQKHAIKWH